MTSDFRVLSTKLKLPCGVVLKNRLVKAAMTEGLAGPDGLANQKHVRLYRTWAEGGSAVLITGNVMVDGTHLERPGNVILDRPLSLTEQAPFKAWAAAGSETGCQVWMQLSHSGRQTQKRVNPHPKSASDIQLRIPGGQFARPEPLTGKEIRKVITRFAVAAEQAQMCGFTGVQVHAAHGYLISQFLSPAANHRDDDWGGSLENRARFLRTIIADVRARTGSDFCISVKLNSSDFQKGGFGPDDARQVVHWLEQDGVDLIELSGGTYEQPKMLEFEGLEPPEEIRVRDSTRQREAFFLEFAADLKQQVSVPLMVTGGFRSAAGMADAVASDGIAAIGLGRPLCGDPNCVNRLLQSGDDLPRFERQLGNPSGYCGVNSPLKLVKVAASFAVMAWYYDQIVALGDGRPVDLNPSTFSRLIALQLREARWMKARKALLQQRQQ